MLSALLADLWRLGEISLLVFLMIMVVRKIKGRLERVP